MLGKYLNEKINDDINREVWDRVQKNTVPVYISAHRFWSYIGGHVWDYGLRDCTSMLIATIKTKIKGVE